MWQLKFKRERWLPAEADGVQTAAMPRTRTRDAEGGTRTKAHVKGKFNYTTRV